MMTTFFIFTMLFIVVSIGMILIILAQRSQGGGLAGAFGGAGGGTDTVFGGRVGDALTWATVIGFVLYLFFAVMLNRSSASPSPSENPSATATTGDGTGETGAPPAGATGPTTPLPPASRPADPVDDATDDNPADGGP